MTRLIGAHEPAPVTISGDGASSPFVVTCDHAGKRIPEKLGDLGLSAADLDRHIAWDIGAAGVAKALVQELDACVIMQNYSRLVVDCNRPPNNAQLIPEKCEQTRIPGNCGLDDDTRNARLREIYYPYHDHIARVLDARTENQDGAALVAIHSFTPVYLEVARPWHIGVLYGRDRSMADPMLRCLRNNAQLCVGDNEPYRIDQKDYGIPVHGEQRGIPHILIEIRQDLIATATAQQRWARELSGVLPIALHEARGK